MPEENVLHVRFPMRFLTVTVVLTGLVLAWLGWGTYHSLQLIEAERQSHRIEQLPGRILHLDEVLTMSARMAVTTGDLQWEERYRHYETELDATIKEALRLAPEAHIADAAAQTNVANIKLVEMENQAFGLVREDRVDEAKSILFSDAYEKQKRVYAKGMAEFTQLLHDAAHATVKSEQRRTFLSVTSVLVAILILLIAWLLVLQTVGNWRTQLVENHHRLAERTGELAELNQALDQKVAERTAELQASRTTALRRLEEAEEAREKAEEAEKAVSSEQELLLELLSLQERDRKLVAYEIHDGLAQQLTGCKFLLESVHEIHEKNPDEAWKAFDAGLELLGRSIDEARRLISGLRPPILDESGIVAAVDYLINEIPQDGGLRIEFRHDVEFDRLAPPLESTVFRIVQETLNNACQHSHSDKVSVELVQKNAHLHIKVQDWGVGFDPAGVRETAFGLAGIQERVRLFHGNVTIVSIPGEGTSVEVDLPLTGSDLADRHSWTTAATAGRMA